MRLGAALALAVAYTACGASEPRTEGSSLCGRVETPPSLGAAHVEAGDRVTFPTFPPSSGPHDPRPLESGVYERPLTRDLAGSPGATLLRAVHSLEHGYVIVFHEGLGPDEAELRSRFARARKVIVAPARGLRSKVILVAWERVQRCRGLDVRAIESFMSRFREKTAPEPGAA